MMDQAHCEFEIVRRPLATDTYWFSLRVRDFNFVRNLTRRQAFVERKPYRLTCRDTLTYIKFRVKHFCRMGLTVDEESDIMFKHILIPTDGSELSEKAVRAGIDFAKSIGAKVTGFRAIEMYPWAYADYVPMDVYSPEQRAEQEKSTSEKILAPVTNYAKSVGVTSDVQFAKSVVPFEGIIKAAEDNGCDLIFMASHGRRGLAGLLLGSETVKVLTHCKIPALVYR